MRKTQVRLSSVCADFEAYERASGSSRSSADKFVNLCSEVRELPSNFSRRLFQVYEFRIYHTKFLLSQFLFVRNSVMDKIQQGRPKFFGRPCSVLLLKDCLQCALFEFLDELVYTL